MFFHKERQLLIKGLSQNQLAILFTLAIHLGLLFILSLQSLTLPGNHQAPNEIEPIKSYLYVAPKPKPVPEPKSELNTETKQTIETVTSPEEQPAQTDEDKTIDPPTNIEEDLPALETPITSEQPKELSPLPRMINQPKSVRAQLLDLKKQIQQQGQQNEFEEYQRYRQGDVMAGKHTAVPHSQVPLTDEEKREQATTRMGSFDIIKGDDGNCTLIEDLSYLGLDHKPASGFDCGESKFDKSFREHMEKTLKKLGKDQK